VNLEYCAYALGVVFLFWLGVTLFVLLTRLIYDVRLGLVSTARRLVEGRAAATLGDADELERILRRLPRRTVERVAADTATAPALAAVFARHAASRNGMRLRAAAAGHTSEVSKWRRIAALRILARSGSDAALPLLAQALAEGDADVVNAALATLGDIRDERAAAILVQALRDGAGPRSRIATQLDEFPLDVGGMLLPLLRDWDASVRYWAVKLLSRYRTLTSLPLELAPLGGDEDAAVRAAVAETLGSLGGPAAISITVELLADEIPFVRGHAARALGAQGRPALAALVAELLLDEDWWVRAGSKRALEQLGLEATQYVVPHLESADVFARNGAAEVLQNTGVVDRLAHELVDDPANEPARSLLRSIIEAGGDRYEEAMIARAEGGEKRIEALLKDVRS
jgi:HEAT repeat protein